MRNFFELLFIFADGIVHHTPYLLIILLNVDKTELVERICELDHAIGTKTSCICRTTHHLNRVIYYLVGGLPDFV